MDSLNNCWRCSSKNPSTAMVCRSNCLAEQIPTRTALTRQRLKYLVYSFGQRADQLSCKRLHASWLDEAVRILRTQTLVAVRVGVKPNFAIIIRDANGVIRRTFDITASMTNRLPPPTGNDITDFLAVARLILLTDPDQDKGKMIF